MEAISRASGVYWEFVDALPDSTGEPSPGQSNVTSEPEVGLRVMPAAICNAFDRPPHHYGITPY
jgi:hypothetical protein